MMNKFDEIFEAVMYKYNKEAFEVINSALFNEVEAEIAECFGADVLDADEYFDWFNEIAED